MKKLFLIRHASAVAGGNIPDFQRSLSKSGKNNAVRIVERLNSILTLPDLIITSPAIRALETAEIFAKTLEYPHNKILINRVIYEGILIESFLNLMAEIDNNHATVMIFGHNPTLTELASILIPDFKQQLLPAGIVGMEFDFNDWRKIGDSPRRLIYHDSP